MNYYYSQTVSDPYSYSYTATQPYYYSYGSTVLTTNQSAGVVYQVQGGGNVIASTHGSTGLATTGGYSYAAASYPSYAYNSGYTVQPGYTNQSVGYSANVASQLGNGFYSIIGVLAVIAVFVLIGWFAFARRR